MHFLVVDCRFQARPERLVIAIRETSYILRIVPMPYSQHELALAPRRLAISLTEGCHRFISCSGDDLISRCARALIASVKAI